MNTSNRIDQCFADLKADNKTAFIAFITAGDPEHSVTVDTMHALVRGGTDIIELGVPFSDPSADGTSIQGSNERALKHNVGILDVLAMVQQFRQTDKITPVILMGYLNPIENIGAKEFALAAARAQMLEQAGKISDTLVACVGGGSNATGLFYDFPDDEDVKNYGVEAAGLDLEVGKHAAPLCKG